MNYGREKQDVGHRKMSNERNGIASWGREYWIWDVSIGLCTVDTRWRIYVGHIRGNVWNMGREYEEIGSSIWNVGERK